MQWGNLFSEDTSSDECALEPDDITASPLPSLADVDSVAKASKTIAIGLDELKKVGFYCSSKSLN